MLKWLKTYLFKRRYRSALQKVGENDVFLQDIDTIGLIFDATQYEDRDFCITFAERLRNVGIKMELLGYLDNKIVENLSFPFLTYDKSDINWYGIVSTPEIEKFTDQPTHLTVIANLKNRPHMELMGLQCNTLLRMGTATQFNDKKDIIIDQQHEEMRSFLNNTMDLLRELQLISPLIHV